MEGKFKRGDMVVIHHIPTTIGQGYHLLNRTVFTVTSAKFDRDLGCIYRTPWVDQNNREEYFPQANLLLFCESESVEEYCSGHDTNLDFLGLDEGFVFDHNEVVWEPSS